VQAVLGAAVQAGEAANEQAKPDSVLPALHNKQDLSWSDFSRPRVSLPANRCRGRSRHCGIRARNSGMSAR